MVPGRRSRCKGMWQDLPIQRVAGSSAHCNNSAAIRGEACEVGYVNRFLAEAFSHPVGPRALNVDSLPFRHR